MINQLPFEMTAPPGARLLQSPSVSWRVVLAVTLVMGIVIALCVGAADSASAQTLEPVQVYATYGSADTGPNGPVSILDTAGAGIQRVYFWATGGSEEGATGPVCTQEGGGDALCGISFTLSVTGGYQMVGFLPNLDFDKSDAHLPFRMMLASTGKLVGNAFDLGVATPEIRYLGELRLRANGANDDSQIVVTGDAIGADLSMRNITQEAIIVPEPAAPLMLGAGVLCLLLSVSTRRRHSLSELRAR